MNATLDFNSELEKQFQELAAKKVMVLATCAENHVTARNMSVIVLDQKVYFQTDRLMEKARQIEINDQVALCADDFQLEGTAKILGPWGENQALLEAYLRVHKNSYLRYQSLTTEVLVEVKITRLKRWQYLNGDPYLYELDLVNKGVHLEKYKID
jgi:general stress protein 26